MGMKVNVAFNKNIANKLLKMIKEPNYINKN
jgi:hypothetical protein